ncbi:hypothetical protein AB0C18_41080 [Nonomuraea muscovyensis]|jgi:hypothetical protein|uniref:Sensor domain-containing protein n=1 Tax=Nonomuraea muscovyensis TaxID=1124761 RepID=A0A7X0EXC8_9ACTN|nr:hypothetical protein [Nonomuraea muscovyensis]MBB6344526.1 hypothetical protein [Nonomuraea muscovyensis]
MECGLRMLGLVATGGLLAGSLAGCGGGAHEEVRPDARATARLHEVLNDRPRLPDGFSPRAERPWRAPFEPKNTDCLTVLEPAAGRAPARALTAQAAVSYRGDELGEQAAVGLARYAGSEAEEHLGDLAEAMAECRAMRSPGGTRLRLRPLPAPLREMGDEVGDEMVGAELRGKLKGYPYVMDVVLVRSGDTLVSVVHTGLAGVDPERTRQLLGAVLKMATA